MGSDTTMNAAVLHGPNDLRFEVVERPIPKEDEALVAIAVNGICGSDIHFFKEGRLGPFVVDRPYIPGHEAAGRVDRVGASAAGIREGDRVAIEPGIPCRRCRHCKTGRYNLCRNVRFLSAPPENGTFAEYAAVPADFLHRIPDTMSDEEAAFAEPLSVAIQACNRAALKPATSFVVLGAGPIGLITYLTAVAYGAGPGIIVDLNANRLEFARSLSGVQTLNPVVDDVVRSVVDATDGGAGTVFDCTGSSKAAALAPELAAAGGVVVLVGWPEVANPEFPLETILEKEIDVRGVNRYCNTFPAAIMLLSERRVDLRPLISHRFAFSSVVDAFSFAAGSPSETIKVMVGATGA
ncbi:MAG: NAD(P)-dependent alcohol dehydrogenase [Spirochaetaceae bacterium]|nr:MAG: NAD(P)-dependent alcohol dehydrogenase [Spirochaetaceae bacterium]